MCVNSFVDSDIVHFRVFDAGPICAYSSMDSGIPHLGVFISAAICVNSSMDSDILQLRGLASSSSPSLIIICPHRIGATVLQILALGIFGSLMLGRSVQTVLWILACWRVHLHHHGSITITITITSAYSQSQALSPSPSAVLCHPTSR